MAGGEPARDLVATAARAGDQGAVSLTIELAAAPTDGYLIGLVGTSSGTGCGAPFVLFTALPSGGAAYGRETAAGPGDVLPAQMTVDGDTVTLSASDAARLALPFAGVSRDGSVDDLYDETERTTSIRTSTSGRGH